MAVLSEVAVDIVAAEDEARFRVLMQAHHYLGAVPSPGAWERLGHLLGIITDKPDMSKNGVSVTFEIFQRLPHQRLRLN